MRVDPQPALRGCPMSPVQMAIREQQSRVRPVPGRPYPPADVLLVPPKEAALEIVVDWQLPSDTDGSRR